MLPNCTASFPRIDIPTEMINAAAYLQFNPAHQVLSCPVTQSEIIPNANVQRTIGTSAPMAETFFNPSSFVVIPANPFLPVAPLLGNFFPCLLIFSLAHYCAASSALLCLGLRCPKHLVWEHINGEVLILPEQFTGNWWWNVLIWPCFCLGALWCI